MAQTTLEKSMRDLIDDFIADIRSQTLIEQAKCVDFLLDLRLMASSNASN